MSQNSPPLKNPQMPQGSENNQTPSLEDHSQLEKRIITLENEIEELKLREKRYFYAMKSLENNPDGVFWCDAYGRIRYINEAACEELGYSKEELLKMTLTDIDANYPKETWTPNSEFMTAAIKRNVTHLQTRHRHRDGHLIPVEIVMTELESEGEGLGCANVHDITDRIKAEEQRKIIYGRLSVLYEIFEKTSGEIDAVILVRETAKILENALSFDALVVYLMDEISEELLLLHAVGISEALLKAVFRSGEKIFATHKAIINRQIEYVKYRDLPHNKWTLTLLKNGFTDAVGFPIINTGDFFGGITLINSKDKAIDIKDRELLKAVCSHLSTAIHKARLFETLNREIEERKSTEKKLKKANSDLEKSACTDQLTGAWNRRFFLTTVENEMARAKQHKNTMSLLLFDVDNFKEINDRYGHLAGDRVLVDFARIITSCIRDTDSLTRWGGEEFIVLAPNLTEKDAEQLAERLRILIAAHDFDFDGSVTVSIGIAEFDHNDNLDQWIKKADDALYRAKELGRNRVELSR